MELVKILLKAQGCGLQRGIDGLGKVSIHLLESTRSLRYKPIDHVLVLEAACLCIPEVQVGELLTYHHCQLDVGLAMVLLDKEEGNAPVCVGSDDDGDACHVCYH